MPHRQYKTLTRSGKKAAGEVSSQQLALINAFSLCDLKADELYVRTFYVCHNALDRDTEVFDERLLQDFERTLPGKGCFIKHPQGYDGDSGPGEGKWFEAQLLSMSQQEARELLKQPDLTWLDDSDQAMVLEASMYMVRHPDNDFLLKKLDAGIAGDCSIGFSAKALDPIHDSNGDHFGAKWIGPGEALECSLVWLGAQPGARAHKDAGGVRTTDTPPTQHDYTTYLGDASMKNKTLEGQFNGLKSAGAKADLGTAMLVLGSMVGELEASEKNLDTLTEELTTLKSAGDPLAGLKTALGDQADSLLADPQGLVALVSAGKELRTQLVDDITAAQRSKGFVADDEATVNTHKAALSAQPLNTLKMLAESLGVTAQASDSNGTDQQQGGKGAQLGGGDPAGGRAQHGSKGSDLDHIG